MKIMKYYVLDNDLFNDSEFAYGEKIEVINYGPATKCEECGCYLTMKKWLPPYNVKVSKKTIGDFIFGTLTSFIISAKVKNKYDSSGLMGLSNFQPVNIYYRGELLDTEGYFHPDITLSNAK